MASLFEVRLRIGHTFLITTNTRKIPTGGSQHAKDVARVGNIVTVNVHVYDARILESVLIYASTMMIGLAVKALTEA
jgi:hypothetical protein